MDDYAEFAEVANSFWANMYFKFTKIVMMKHEVLIYQDTVWKKKDSPIVIDKSTFIFPGVTLTIEPGTKVLIGDDTIITCQGMIKAVGREDDPIVFTWKDEGKPWNMLEFLNAIDGKHKNRGIVEFRHCIVEHGKGLKLNCSNFEVSDCIFRYNESSPIRVEYSAGVIKRNIVYGNTTERESEGGNGGGIKVFTNLSVIVEDNEVYDNVSAGGRDGGGGIYAFAYDNGDILVQNNIVKNNHSDRKGGGIFAYDSVVKNNIVKNNVSDMTGGGIYALQSVVEDNVVTDNASDEGGGIFSNQARIVHNLIQNNKAAKGAGIFQLGDGLIEANTLVENKGTTDQGAVVLILGNAPVRFNNIIAGSGYALSFQSHNLSPDLNAQENYWGTTDERKIEASVYDWMEDSKVGLVDWAGYASGPVEKAYPIPVGAPSVYDTDLNDLVPSIVRGIIETDTVWSAKDISDYKIMGNLLIREGKTLTITSGVTLHIAPGVSIRVRGNLVAEGSEKKQVVFTGDLQTPWDRILFEDRSLDETEQKEGRNVVSMMDHCLVENGKGIIMDGKGADLLFCTIRNNQGTGVRMKEVSVNVKGCTITGNVSDSDGGGIYAYGSRAIDIHRNVITNNRAMSGGGIFAYGYQSNVAVDMRDNVIENNTSLGDGGGVWASRSALVGNKIIKNTTENKGGGIYASFALVDDNTITQNSAQEGGGIYGEANTSFTGNLISENVSVSGQGGGAYLNFWGLSKHNKTFDNNRVENNKTSDGKGTGGICLSGTLEFNKNSILKNAGIQLNNMTPSSSDVISAKGCFWGTSDLKKIADLIFDGKDDPDLSVVEFDPIAKALPSTK